MNGTYNIILESQLGPKSGTLFLKATRRRLWCCLSILGNENILVGIHDKDTFSLRGKFKTALGPVKCQLSGKLLGPNNFDSTVNDKKQFKMVVPGGETAETVDFAENVNDTNGADVVRDRDVTRDRDDGGVNDIGGIPRENILEASISIDGKEYRISGTLA